jgi:dTDP-4-amino-4,6-dideoxygalactose transaminase
VCTSFGKGKLISGGELGVATANEDRFRDRMLLYGHVNRVPQALLTAEYRHMHNAVGIKYRPHPFAMALALDQLQTYSERSRKLVENARRFEQGVSQLAGFSTFPAPEPASRVYWRVPVQVLDTARLGSLPSLLEMLQVSGCPVEHRRGLVIPEHNALTEFYGVNTRRNFPVAERLQSQTLLVNAFALYQPESVEKALAQFSSVAQSSF